jgi:opacity protein-like surface antigen
MADVDWIVSARARLGVVAGRALFYATGGVAMTGLSSQVDAFGVHASTSSTSPAFVAGGRRRIRYQRAYRAPRRSASLFHGRGQVHVPVQFGHDASWRIFDNCACGTDLLPQLGCTLTSARKYCCTNIATVIGSCDFALSRHAGAAHNMVHDMLAWANAGHASSMHTSC